METSHTNAVMIIIIKRFIFLNTSQIFTAMDVIDLVDSDSDHDLDIQSVTTQDFAQENDDIQSFQNYPLSQLSQTSFQSQSTKASQYSIDPLSISSKRQRTTASSKAVKQTVAEKNNKEREIRHQITGKYKREEIAVIICNELKDSPLLKHLNTILTTESPGIENIIYDDSLVANLIRWTYRPKVLGGLGKIGDINVTVLPFVTIFFPCDEFIRLVTLSSNSLTFEELGNEFKKITGMLVADSCPSHTQISFLLVGIDNELLKLRKVSESFNFIHSLIIFRFPYLVKI